MNSLESSGIRGPILDALAELRWEVCESSKGINAYLVIVAELRRQNEACADVAELIDELATAHQIILRALNCLTGDARGEFLRTLKEDGLDGEGLTRYHERKDLLTRVGTASHPDDGCLDCLRKERAGGAEAIRSSAAIARAITSQQEHPND